MIQLCKSFWALEQCLGSLDLSLSKPPHFLDGFLQCFLDLTSFAFYQGHILRTWMGPLDQAKCSASLMSSSSHLVWSSLGPTKKLQCLKFQLIVVCAFLLMDLHRCLKYFCTVYNSGWPFLDIQQREHGTTVEQICTTRAPTRCHNSYVQWPPGTLYISSFCCLSGTCLEELVSWPLTQDTEIHR